MMRERIFVVEDHAPTARSLKVYLEACGFAVTLAESVRSALELAEEIEFDALLCDLNLPDGTGWDLMAELKRGHPVPAIAFSAYDEPEHIERSHAAGFLEHVVKGSSPESLVAAIRRALPPKREPEEKPAARP